MCDKRSTRKVSAAFSTFKVDNCLQHIIEYLNKRGIVTVGCCCGHGRYKSTILVCDDDDSQYPRELFSGAIIMRTRRFYVTDKDGYYYIPELEKAVV